jgi:hypothetical protein
MSLSEPGLDRDEADRALERLGEESDRIAEALVAMDSHPGHQLLRTAPLSGRTRQRWDEASAAMATLWEQFGSYRTLLDQAREVRARRGRPGQAELDELTRLLTGAVVELNREQVPIERRGLTGPALIVERVSLAELVSRMKAGYAAVTEVLAEVDAAAAAGLRRIDQLETELGELTALAESLGQDPAPLHRVRDAVIDARELLAADPLEFAGRDPLAGLENDLAAVRARFDGLADARDTVDERVAALTAILTELDRVQQQAATVVADVLEKIANPGLAAFTDPLPALRQGMAELPGLRAAADWRRVGARLAQLDAAAAEALAAAKARLAAATGLLDRRAELRGRLDAYRAKAARLGRAEDLALAALHTAAHDLLYTRPCDLAAALRAVNRYQQAVQEGSR